MGAHGFGELVVALSTTSGGQVAGSVGDDLHSDLFRVHIGDALRAELDELVKEPGDGFEHLVARVGSGIGGVGQEVLLKCDDRSGTHRSCTV